jgi:hypothetical protein
MTSTSGIFDMHTLEVRGVQEIACRRFIYNKIGKTGSFVLHFDDIKFSFPTSMVTGYGCIAFCNTQIQYEVGLDYMTLKSNDRDALVAMVIESLDEYL